MIEQEFVYGKVIPLIKEKGKMIDVLMIQNLFENKEDEIIKELKTYQNKDKGLGNCLEPDIRMPFSSVAATCRGIDILEEIKSDVKEDFVKEIVEYLENVYDNELERFVMVTKEVEKYPHAIWWMYKDVLKNFPFGNPDPEVIGFLYQNRKYLKTLNINSLVNKVVDFIKSDGFKDSTMHTILSVAKFYKRVDRHVQNLIIDDIIYVVDKELEGAKDKWDEYSFEPYKIYITEKILCTNKMTLVNENLSYNLNKVEELSVVVPWKWYIYDEEFEVVKNDWLGALYFSMIKALRLHRTF